LAHNWDGTVSIIAILVDMEIEV